jgi:hypothetical protein
MKNVMLTAIEARAKSQNDSIIFNEIRDIEDAILNSVAAGLYDASVSGTTMTDTSVDGIATARLYFSTWQGTIDDRAKYIQMGKVLTYFTDLGYSIERRTNSTTGDTMIWIISW